MSALCMVYSPARAVACLLASGTTYLCLFHPKTHVTKQRDRGWEGTRERGAGDAFPRTRVTRACLALVSLSLQTQQPRLPSLLLRQPAAASVWLVRPRSVTVQGND